MAKGGSQKPQKQTPAEEDNPDVVMGMASQTKKVREEKKLSK